MKSDTNSTTPATIKPIRRPELDSIGDGPIGRVVVLSKVVVVVASSKAVVIESSPKAVVVVSSTKAVVVASTKAEVVVSKFVVEPSKLVVSFVVVVDIDASGIVGDIVVVGPCVVLNKKNCTFILFTVEGQLGLA